MQFKLTPIIPRPLNISGLQHALIDGMRDMGERIREEFEDTTKTWEHQPTWEPKTTIPVISADAIQVTTETGDSRYRWVSEGTQSHPIYPRNAKVLAFPGTFIPKTSPGIIGSGVGMSGPVDQVRNWVAHPGVEARKFAETIAKNNKNNFSITMGRAMKVAARASGHRL